MSYANHPAPRNQWLHNKGYCGEVSCVMAGLKFGQYLSQYDVRDISTGSQQKHYLVGDNDIETAQRLKLVGEEWPGADCHDAFDTCTKQLLGWIKKMVRRGHAVTITVYMNQWLFHGNKNLSAGHFDYDHIVSVDSIESQFDDELYHPTDVIVIEDHALWDPRFVCQQLHQTPYTGCDWLPPYLMRYYFKDFMGSRERANDPEGNVYTLPSTTQNYAFAHTGPADDDGVLQRVRVDTNLNYETPEIADLTDIRPPAMPLVITIRVSGLQPGEHYKLYRYNNETLVPSMNFNANASSAVQVFDVQGQNFAAKPGSPPNSTFLMTQDIMSDEKAIYRCVHVDAP